MVVLWHTIYTKNRRELKFSSKISIYKKRNEKQLQYVKKRLTVQQKGACEATKWEMSHAHDAIE